VGEITRALSNAFLAAVAERVKAGRSAEMEAVGADR
jgi:hypothetical protein